MTSHHYEVENSIVLKPNCGGKSWRKAKVAF
jgi:hypothetical protein